jgi:hypothetical protein
MRTQPNVSALVDGPNFPAVRNYAVFLLLCQTF